MNWDAVGAMGEIAGALAVIATIFYLARQVKEQTKAQRAATHWQMIQSRKNDLRLVLENPSIDQTLRKAADSEDLTEDEFATVFIHTEMLVRGFEGELHQHSLGFLDDDEIAARKVTLKRNGFIKLDWLLKHASHILTPLVKKEIEDMIKDKDQVQQREQEAS